jgi:thioester reductase-like protein
MPAMYFTGFPGFLGSELLPRILTRNPGRIAYCLVQPKFAALANERAMGLMALRPEFAGRIRLVEGDLTSKLSAPGLEDIVEIYHLAAVYDLSVKREFGMRVNVDGTKSVLELARRSPRLKRLHYVSTCYVSGRYEGVFNETDLEKGQTFNNFYEETKYLAEVEVQRAMKEGLPATIYRPSVVVGDSVTGSTQKFDGPYFVIQWLLRQPRLAVLPVAGNPRSYRFNVVPRDFVVKALEYLSAQDVSNGRVYHLADPKPLTVHETIDAIALATQRKVLRIPMPKVMAKAALDYVPGVYQLMRIPSAAVDYFVHPTTYGTSQATADLAPSGIRAPHFNEYLSKLVEFVRAHPEIGSAAMV